jgi:hypothetical protein
MATARIMCIGDSMVIANDTSASGARSFRGRLQQRLTTGGWLWNLIGSQQAAPAVGTDPDHEGYSGSTIAQTTARVPTILAGDIGVDIIIVLVGWVDVLAANVNIATDYNALASAITTAKPSAKVVLCTLPPARGLSPSVTGSTYPAYATVNTAIRALLGGNVTFVDLATQTASGGGGLTERARFLEDVINETKGTSDALRGGSNGQYAISSAYGGNRINSFAALRDACAQWSYNPPGSRPTAPGSDFAPRFDSSGNEQRGHPYFIDRVSQVFTWFHSWQGPGHSATNTGTETANIFVMIVTTDGEWYEMFSGARMAGWFWGQIGGGVGFITYGATPAGCTFRQQPDGRTTFWRAGAGESPEAWPIDTVPSRGPKLQPTPYPGMNRDVFARAAGFLIGCQVRLALDNPNGPNDLDRGSYLVQLGSDMQAVLPNGSKVNYDGRYDWLGWPRVVNDGNVTRYVNIRSPQWRTVATFSGPWQGFHPGTGQPWANGFPDNWPYSRAPYGLSEAQLRANPPPLPENWFPITGEGTGTGVGAFQLTDYITASTYEMTQSGADIVAQAIYDRLNLSGLLVGFEVGSEQPPEPAPGASTRPAYRDQKTGGLWTYADTVQSVLIAPAWLTAAGTRVSVNTGGSLAFQMRAGGSPAPTYSILSGPGWVAINSATGNLTGTAPQSGGDNVVRVAADNGVGDPIELDVTVFVQELPVIVTTTLPAGTQNVPYPTTTIVLSGPEPLLLVAQNLPTGLSLVGRDIVGTPTGQGRTVTFTVTAPGGATATSSIEIAVAGVVSEDLEVVPASLTLSLASGPVTITIRGGDGELLSALKGLAARASVTKPGYVAAPAYFVRGELVITPVGVGSGSITITYGDQINDEKVAVVPFVVGP